LLEQETNHHWTCFYYTSNYEVMQRIELNNVYRELFWKSNYIQSESSSKRV